MTTDTNDYEILGTESKSYNHGISVKRNLPEERQALVQQIHAQRALLAQRIGPVPEPHRDYPRSMIMRFLTQRPALAASLLGKAGALILGARFFKSSGAALAVASLVQSSLSKRR